MTFLFLILSSTAFAGPAELASKLESGAVCGGSETAFRLVLDKAWETETGRDVFIGACNNNPAAAKLFPSTLSHDDVVTKTAAYCAFRPALRLCMVCSI